MGPYQRTPKSVAIKLLDTQVFFGVRGPWVRLLEISWSYATYAIGSILQGIFPLSVKLTIKIIVELFDFQGFSTFGCVFNGKCRSH